MEPIGTYWENLHCGSNSTCLQPQVCHAMQWLKLHVRAFAMVYCLEQIGTTCTAKLNFFWNLKYLYYPQMNKWLCNTNANAKIANTDPGHSESKQGQREYMKGSHSKCRDCISCFNSSEGIVQPCAAVYHTAFVLLLHVYTFSMILGTQSHAMTGVH